MAFSKVDPNSGETKYNKVWFFVIGLIFSLIFALVVFFVWSKHSATSTANRPVLAASGRGQLDKIAESPDVAAAAKLQQARDYYNSVPQSVSGVDMGTYLQGQSAAPQVSNAGDRLGVCGEGGGEDRLRRFGNSAASGGSQGSDDMVSGGNPGQQQNNNYHEQNLSVMAWYGSGAGSFGSGQADYSPSSSGTTSGGGSIADDARAAVLKRLGLSTSGGAGLPGMPAGAGVYTGPSSSGTESGADSVQLRQDDLVPSDADTRRAQTMSANSVPTGSQVSVVLVNNVISSSIQQRVWAVTAQELVFRRQVQLPKGVMLGGYASGSPVRDQLDVVFDIMVFPDGTELKFSGHAVNAYSPKAPGLEGMRGLVDIYREPPLWSQVFPILLQFVVGYTNTAFPANTVVSSTSSSMELNARQQMNQGINSAVQLMQQKVMTYLEQYSPYVYLRKGLTFKIEMDSTVDFSHRQLGGFSYDDLLKSVKQESDQTAAAQEAAAARSKVGAPEYLGLPANSTAQDIQQRLQAVQAALAMPNR